MKKLPVNIVAQPVVDYSLCRPNTQSTVVCILVGMKSFPRF